MGTRTFPVVKSGRGVTLTPHPLLVPWSWSSRVIPLLPLWAVRPVQSLSACTRVHFNFFTSFMQSIYNCIPETRHTSRVYSYAATIHGTCYVISHAECFALWHRHFPQYVRSTQYGCLLVVPWFRVYPICCSGNCLSDFALVPVAPIITGITFVFKFQVRYFSILRCSHFFRIFSASFFITFFSWTYVFFTLKYNGLWCPVYCRTVLSVCAFWFHNIVTFMACFY